MWAGKASRGRVLGSTPGPMKDTGEAPIAAGRAASRSSPDSRRTFSVGAVPRSTSTRRPYPVSSGRQSIDALAQHLARLEVRDEFRRQKHRRSGLRVARRPRATEMNQEAAEAAELDAPAFGEARRHVFEHHPHRELHVAPDSSSSASMGTGSPSSVSSNLLLGILASIQNGEAAMPTAGFSHASKSQRAAPRFARVCRRTLNGAGSLGHQCSPVRPCHHAGP